jgi:hypothetical protein
MLAFNAGYIQGVKVRNGKIMENLTQKISCAQLTVGFKRFFTAKDYNHTVDKVVCVPINSPVASCVFVEARFFQGLGSDKPYIYKVVQEQECFDKKPPYIQLSLQKMNTEYDDVRE